MKKIAFYIESMIVGGAEKVLIDLVNHMDYTRYDITVIAIFRQSVYDGYSCQFETLFDPHVHYVSLIDNRKKWKYRLFNRAYAHLSKSWIYSALVKEQYDIEVAFYEGFPTEFVAHSTNQRSKKFAWLHTDNTRLHEYKSMEALETTKRLYQAYDMVVGVSNQVVQSFHNFFPGIPTRVIYNVLDTAEIIRKSQECGTVYDENTITFLTVGRLIQIKGYLRLLKALTALKKEGFCFRLIMVGEGALRAEIESVIRENGLEQMVFLQGMQQNPYQYMPVCDYFVCSSFAEGLSTVVMEAIICGLPVITTDCSGMKDILGDAGCGLICENSEEGIYDALKFVLQHPEEREKMAASCEIRKQFFDIGGRLKEFDMLFLGE